MLTRPTDYDRLILCEEMMMMTGTEDGSRLSMLTIVKSQMMMTMMITTHHATMMVSRRAAQRDDFPHPIQRDTARYDWLYHWSTSCVPISAHFYLRLSSTPSSVRSFVRAHHDAWLSTMMIVVVLFHHHHVRWSIRHVRSASWPWRSSSVSTSSIMIPYCEWVRVIASANDDDEYECTNVRWWWYSNNAYYRYERWRYDEWMTQRWWRYRWLERW